MAKKLTLEELAVTSFDPAPEAVRYPDVTFTDPTAATDCYWCPGDTFDCY